MVVEDCIFDSNEATEAAAAISFGPADDPSSRVTRLRVVGSQFTGNTSSIGGAVYINQAWADFEKCTFSANTASTGACVHSSQSSLTATNCLFAHNTSDNAGGAFFLDGQSELDMRNCTTWECDSELGGAVQAEHGSQAAITNSIVWQCLPAALAVSGITARIDASYSCIQGGAPGVSNVDEDP